MIAMGDINPTVNTAGTARVTPVANFGTVWFDFPCVPKGRPRLGRRKRVFTPEKTIQFEDAVRAHWMAETGGIQLVGPVRMEMDLEKDGFWVTLTEMPNVKRITRGDLDNQAKAAADGLQHKRKRDRVSKKMVLVTEGAMADDRQIAELIVRDWKAA